ncbi:hypothetical protein Tco_1010309 [Tanacetum coccineum]
MGRDKAKCLKKKAPRSSGSSSTMNDEALARLMVFEMAMYNERAMKMKKEEHLAFWRSEGGRHMEEIRSGIKAKWNLEY